jgi:hypothetical protein
MKLFIIILVLATSFISTNSYAGAVPGPIHFKDVIKPMDTNIYYGIFKKDDISVLKISGDGSTDFDCYLYDENNNHVAEDIRGIDECLIVWSPKWTGKFKIVIRNLGAACNEFTISSN